VSVSWQLETVRNNKGYFNMYVKMAIIITTYMYRKIEMFALFPVLKEQFLHRFAQFLNIKNKLGVPYLLLSFSE
jgi:hypothetical protein